MFVDDLNDVITYLEFQQTKGLKYIQISDFVLRQLFENKYTHLTYSQPKLNSPVPFQTTAPFVQSSFPHNSSQTSSTPFIFNMDTSTNVKIDLTKKLSPSEKIDKMNELRNNILKCSQCPHLVHSRRSVVFGIGDVNSPLMFIGEAPGADEDAQGEPFVGRAGQILTKIITAMGLSREKVFIANILKCRPDTPGQTSGNRPPTPAEMKTCFPWLAKQIEIVQPKVIVALGATAVNGLLSQTTPISRLRGHFQPFHGIQVMPTFHPSYLLRNATNFKVKRSVWEDMLQVMEFLELPISEKQKNYFLSKQ